MQKVKIKITNELGLHLRPSSKLAQLASKYPCEIWISNDKKRINAKSVLGITMLAAAKGSQVQIECEGIEEEKAVHKIIELFEMNFYEEN